MAVNLSELFSGKCDVAANFSHWTGAAMAMNSNRMASAELATNFSDCTVKTVAEQLQ